MGDITLETPVDGARATVAKEGGHFAADGLEQVLGSQLAACRLIVQQQVRYRAFCLAGRDIAVDDVDEEIAVFEAHHGGLWGVVTGDLVSLNGVALNLEFKVAYR